MPKKKELKSKKYHQNIFLMFFYFCSRIKILYNWSAKFAINLKINFAEDEFSQGHYYNLWLRIWRNFWCFSKIISNFDCKNNWRKLQVISSGNACIINRNYPQKIPVVIICCSINIYIISSTRFSDVCYCFDSLSHHWYDNR